MVHAHVAGVLGMWASLARSLARSSAMRKEEEEDQEEGNYDRAPIRPGRGERGYLREQSRKRICLMNLKQGENLEHGRIMSPERAWGHH